MRRENDKILIVAILNLDWKRSWIAWRARIYKFEVLLHVSLSRNACCIRAFNLISLQPVCRLSASRICFINACTSTDTNTHSLMENYCNFLQWKTSRNVSPSTNPMSTKTMWLFSIFSSANSRVIKMLRCMHSEILNLRSESPWTPIDRQANNVRGLVWRHSMFLDNLLIFISFPNWNSSLPPTHIRNPMKKANCTARKIQLRATKLAFTYLLTQYVYDLISHLNFIWNGNIHFHTLTLTASFDYTSSRFAITGVRLRIHCSFYHYCHHFSVEISINYFTHFHFLIHRRMSLPEARAGRSL